MRESLHNTPCDTALATAMAGAFVVLDGVDGSGKGTQLERLKSALCGAGAVVAHAREPGGTAVGEAVRQILLRKAPAGQPDVMVPVCETLLYAASRAQLVAERIAPALKRGETVLCDRFVTSTIAYQCAAGASEEAVRAINAIAVQGCEPAVTVLLDADPLRTRNRRDASLRDRVESRPDDYQLRVREGYLEQARRAPERFVVVDADQTRDRVFAAIVAGLRARFLPSFLG